MANKSVVLLSVAAGVLALGIAGTSLALAAGSPSPSTAGQSAQSEPASRPTAPATPSARPSPSASPGTPEEAVLDVSPPTEVVADAPVYVKPVPAPDVVPTPGAGEHVVTFSVTSSADVIPVQFYTVGGSPSQSNSNLWIFGEQLTEPTTVVAPWTHSVIIPAGGDPMKDGWGLSVFPPAGVQATCEVTMDGVVISRSSARDLWKCQPGVIN